MLRQPSLLVALGLAIAIATTGCTAAAVAELDGREFVSVSVTENSVERLLVPGTRVRLSFSDGQLSASAGCNHIGAPYRLEAGRLVVGQMAMTEMGCDPPRHAQDEWLSRLLGAAPAVRIDGPNLVLESSPSRVTLLDVEVAEADVSLAGRVWVLESMVRGDVASSVPEGVSASLEFSEDGRVAVATGCNSGGGQAAVEEDWIVFGEIALTRMACPGAGDEVEAAVVAVLGAERVSYTIDGPTLRLRAGELGLDLRAGQEGDSN